MVEVVEVVLGQWDVLGAEPVLRWLGLEVLVVPRREGRGCCGGGFDGDVELHGEE